MNPQYLDTLFVETLTKTVLKLTKMEDREVIDITTFIKHVLFKCCTDQGEITDPNDKEILTLSCCFKFLLLQELFFFSTVKSNGFSSAYEH